MCKSILLDACEFGKELISLFITADKDHQLQIVTGKALCNLALDFERQLAKEETLLRKLVELTHSQNAELKVVCCYTLKNLLFKSPLDVRESVLKHFTYQRLFELLTEDN